MQTYISQIIKGIFAFIIFLCALPATYSQSDNEIAQAVEKVFQYPNSINKKKKLLEMYLNANREDQNRIIELRSSGRPDVWYEIYKSYQALDRRQGIISELPAATREEMLIEFIDYSANLEESRMKAGNYFYAHASSLLKDHDPSKAREAYTELLTILKMYDSFRDVDVLLRQAIARGAGTVRYDLINNSGKTLDPVILSKMENIFTEYENTLKLKSPDKEKTDFSIQIVIQDVSVTPGQVKELRFGEERDILDEEGRVVDTIRCQIDETRQRKSAEISALIRYRDNRMGSVVNKVPVKVESIFLHRYGSLRGDPEAASRETLELVKAREQEYPSDKKMLSDAMDKFREKAMTVMMPAK